jgi:hypothetical protein
LDDILSRLKALEDRVNEKVDCDTFDNELMAIREMIGNMESPGDNKEGSIITTVVTAPPKERGP